MSKLLDQGVAAVRGLSEDRQDMAGELLLSLATRTPAHGLSADQIEDVKQAIAEADRGEFATDEEVASAWMSFRP